MLGSLATIVVSAVIGAISGYLAGRKQDRDRARQRLQGVAGALWADLQRIRQELGPASDQVFDLRVYGSDSIPPGIHEWTAALIPEVADIHPDAVLKFFQLERALHNHGVALRALRTTHDALSDRKDQRDRLLQDLKGGKRDDPAHQGDPTWADRWEQERRLHSEITDLEGRCELWEGSTLDERKRATQVMEDIERQLLTFLPTERRLELTPSAAIDGGARAPDKLDVPSG